MTNRWLAGLLPSTVLNTKIVSIDVNIMGIAQCHRSLSGNWVTSGVAKDLTIIDTTVHIHVLLQIL